MRSTNHQELLIAVVTATLLFFLFSVFMVIYFLMNRRKQKQYQLELAATKQEFEQQLLQSQVEVQEGTYRHIAKELHDNVGQLLSTTKMLMGVTEIKLGDVPDTLVTANATLSKAIQELRMLSRSLDQDWLEQFDFLENLQHEVERINAGETVRASIKCSAPSIALKPEEQIILFRVVQEAIQNALRHAAPTSVQICICQNEHLTVTVVNDGKPLPANFHGMGTNNMRHRVRLFGGWIDWHGDPEETTVAITLPLNPRYENQDRTCG